MEWAEILQVTIRIFLYLLSLTVLIVGILLIAYKDYGKVEEVSGKEKGIRKRIVPPLETNIYTFHQWLLNRRTGIGIICVMTAVAAIVQLKMYLR